MRVCPGNVSGVFLDRGSLGAGLDFSSIEQLAVNWTYFDNTRAADVLARIATAEIVVTNKVCLGAEIFQHAKNLRLICVAATGTNNIDLNAAKKQDITVCNVAAYATDAVAQHVFTLLLALTTRLNEYQQAIKEQRWQHSEFFCLLDYPIHELQGKKLGIIGYGNIGKKVAEIAQVFGMEILIAQGVHSALQGKESLSRLSLQDVLQQADVISLHCPLTAENKAMIAENELRLMKNSAILINTARGGLIDETALLTALKEGQIAAAGLDVLSEEPPDQNNVLLKTLLGAELPNLIITPHIAWASVEARQKLINAVAENIAGYFSEGLLGQPSNVV